VTLEDLGNLGDFIGSIGVIVSLVYVGFQIRQNTEATRDMSAQNLTDAISKTNLVVAGNDELAKLIQSGLFDRKVPSEHEQFRFNTLFFAAYNQIDFAYRQYMAGKLDLKSCKRMEVEIPAYLQLPGAKAWWDQN